ncbi:MAG: PadR family transcriptional regulator [Nitrososphaerota archaeon]|nr:PadR family transcriptional regulator [Nitrososphaerota archaeon]
MSTLTKNFQRKIINNLFNIIILQTIQTEPTHGYQIIARIREKFNEQYRPSTIYPVLIGLEREGCITSEWHTQGNRPQKTYHITPEGQKTLVELTETLNGVINKNKEAEPLIK